MGSRGLVERHPRPRRVPDRLVDARELVLTLDARRVHLGEALEVDPRLGRLAVLEVVVAQPEMGLAIAETRIARERFLDQRAAARLIAQPEPGGSEIVGGLGHLGRQRASGLQVRDGAQGVPASTSKRPRSA